MSTYSPQVIANTIIELSLHDEIKLTPMKLQKIMYFTYKHYLQTTGESLFSERFEKWKYGPVLPSIFYEFNDFKKESITRFARDARGKVTTLNMERIESLAVQTVDYIWHKYRRYSAVLLSQLTHLPGSAWDKANTFLEDKDIFNEPEYTIRERTTNS